MSLFTFQSIGIPLDLPPVYGYKKDGGRILLESVARYTLKVNKSDIGLPYPTPLECELRQDAKHLIVNEDGTAEETPLHSWAKNPLFLDDIIGVHWDDIPVAKPPSGVWVSYKFFGEKGDLLAEVKVGSEIPMHIKQPEGTQHIIMSWDEHTYYFVDNKH